jgi:hypothetical protein
VKDAPKLSAIWVCSDNDPQLETSLRRYLEALESLPYRCDLTIVGNGAARDAATKLEPTLRRSAVPSRIVSLHRGCDQSTAIRAGLQASDGELIALLPSYVQTEPAELHRMLAKIEDGGDYIASWRSPRVDSRWNRLKSVVFNGATRFVTGINLHDVNSGLRVMRRKLAEEVPVYGDLDRFWPILAATQGFRVTEIKTKHLEERVNRGDYRLGVYLRRLLDLLTLFFLTKFTRKPFRFFGLIGSATFASGSLITAILCVQRLMGKSLADRPALVLGVLLMVLGIQLFSLGLLGELIIFTHGKKMQHYHVDKVYESGRQP